MATAPGVRHETVTIFQTATETSAGSNSLATETSAGSSSLARAARILARAALRRCPNCGSDTIFRGYLHQLDSCPGCRLLLDRGEGDFFIGAYTINLIVAELLVFFGGMAVLVWRWPDVPWQGLMWGLAVLMVAAPIALYPFCRQLWLGCDLIFRPAESSDFGPSDIT
jgi:uncharacterized protein (DUF983 family)